MKLFLSLILIGFVQTSFAKNIHCKAKITEDNLSRTVSAWQFSTWPSVIAENIIVETIKDSQGNPITSTESKKVVSGFTGDHEFICYRQFDVFNTCTITEAGLNFTVQCNSAKSVTMVFEMKDNVGYLACFEGSQLKKSWNVGSCYQVEDKK